MVGLGRVELPTSPLSGVRSNQLSYRPARAALTADQEPGGSHKSRSEKVSRTRLNMQGGYAAHDYRKKCDPGKEGSFRLPILAVR